MSNTERFTCTIKDDTPSRQAIQIEHNGLTAWIPRSQIEKRVTDSKGRTELVLPGWLYREKFES